jgi:hypothetical protein
MVSRENDLIAFIGHNILMDTSIDLPVARAVGKTDAVVLCCMSDRYFRKRLENAGARPVLMTHSSCIAALLSCGMRWSRGSRERLRSRSAKRRESLRAESEDQAGRGEGCLRAACSLTG